jgi:hypothetical protein
MTPWRPGTMNCSVQNFVAGVTEFCTWPLAGEPGMSGTEAAPAHASAGTPYREIVETRNDCDRS